MRPSPGVTSLQYFLISSAQEFSSFAVSAASFCWMAFVISVCADAEATDKTASSGSSPSVVSKCVGFFIDRPLILASEPCQTASAKPPRDREPKNDLRRAGIFSLISSLRQCQRETGNSKRKIDPDRTLH